MKKRHINKSIYTNANFTIARNYDYGHTQYKYPTRTSNKLCRILITATLSQIWK
jgi:hypothetical protein